MSRGTLAVEPSVAHIPHTDGAIDARGVHATVSPPAVVRLATIKDESIGAAKEFSVSKGIKPPVRTFGRSSMRPLTAGALAGLFSAWLVSTATAADPYGIYVRPSTGGQVQFYDCGGKLCGKVVKVTDPAKKDTIGKVILSGAAKTGENSWKGDLLNLDDGKTYTGNLTVLNDKQLKLEGCALAIICKGETWQKVK